MRLAGVAAFFEKQGWKARMIIDMKKARMQISTEPGALPEIAQWASSTRTEGMEIQIRTLTIFDRLSMRGQKVKIELRGFHARQITAVSLDTPVMGYRERMSLTRRKSQSLDHSIHKAL